MKDEILLVERKDREVYSVETVDTEQEPEIRKDNNTFSEGKMNGRSKYGKKWKQLEESLASDSAGHI